MGGAACKAKIILNGSTVQNELAELCYLIEEAPEPDYQTGTDLVELLNIAENAVFAFKRLWLESQGFNGPWPAALDNEEVLGILGRVKGEGYERAAKKALDGRADS